MTSVSRHSLENLEKIELPRFSRITQILTRSNRLQTRSKGKVRSVVWRELGWPGWYLSKYLCSCNATHAAGDCTRYSPRLIFPRTARTPNSYGLPRLLYLFPPHLYDSMRKCLRGQTNTRSSCLIYILCPLQPRSDPSLSWLPCLDLCVSFGSD